MDSDDQELTEEKVLRGLAEVDAWCTEWYRHANKVLSDFAAYCTTQWGLSERTVRGYLTHLEFFVEYLIQYVDNPDRHPRLWPKDIQSGGIDWENAGVVPLEAATWDHVLEFAGCWWPSKVVTASPSRYRPMMVAFRRLYKWMLETGRYLRHPSEAQQIIEHATPRKADELAADFIEEYGDPADECKLPDDAELAEKFREIADAHFFAWLLGLLERHAELVEKRKKNKEHNPDGKKANEKRL